MLQRMKQLVVTGSLVGLCAARSAGAWYRVDADANACHQALAYPFATDCNDHTANGYRIQRTGLRGGWDPDPAGGRGVVLSYGRSGNPWTISGNGRLYQRTGTWENGSWSAVPLNACGTGATIGFDTTGTLQNLAIHAPTLEDVPWVIDSSSKVRFWRTSSTPQCWALVETVPGTGTLKSIASYVAPGQTGIWAVRGQSSYFFDGQHWQLIDNNTRTIMSRGYYGTDATGTWLGTYDRSANYWTATPDWNTSFGDAILKLSSGTNTSADGGSYIDVHGHVWSNF